MSRRVLLAALAAMTMVPAAPRAAPAPAKPPPILDMHIHARHAGQIYAGAPTACAPWETSARWDPSLPDFAGLVYERDCDHPIQPAPDAQTVMDQTLAIMERRNIIAMVTGHPDDVAMWEARAPERVIRGLDFRLTASPRRADLRSWSVEELRALHARGELQVLGEVMAQYEGVGPDDPQLEPYWALAEELDLPVAIHLGPGSPADPYSGARNYRARLSDPLLMEEVLVRHPKLRVYLMHAGYPFSERLQALMFTHPQVYVEVGAIAWGEPRAGFWRFLQSLTDAGYGDRILYGTDQGIWPGVIEPGIAAIEDAPFLTEKQKRDILYNNAARFLRLSPEEIARHHGR